MKYVINWTIVGSTTIEAESEDQAVAKFDEMTPGTVIETADQSCGPTIEEVS